MSVVKPAALSSARVGNASADPAFSPSWDESLVPDHVDLRQDEVALLHVQMDQLEEMVARVGFVTRELSGLIRPRK